MNPHALLWRRHRLLDAGLNRFCIDFYCNLVQRSRVLIDGRPRGESFEASLEIPLLKAAKRLLNGYLGHGGVQS